MLDLQLDLGEASLCALLNLLLSLFSPDMFFHLLIGQKMYVLHEGYCISSLACARTDVTVVAAIEMHFAANCDGTRDINNDALNDCLLLACWTRKRLMRRQTYIQQEQHINAP